MNTWKTKSVEVKAARFMGEQNANEIVNWVKSTGVRARYVMSQGFIPGIEIYPNHGWIHAEIGDWVVEFTPGRFHIYPHLPFILMFEEVF